MTSRQLFKRLSPSYFYAKMKMRRDRRVKVEFYLNEVANQDDKPPCLS